MTDYTNTKIELKKLCDLGLTKGIGNRDVPGNLCIESAIALALGEPHTDRPSCVHPADRAFAVGINDAPWSDPMVRGKALYALGCAQLGTAGADRTEWAKRLTEGIIRRVLPIALRAAAEVHPETAHRDALRLAADRCEAEGTRTAYAAYAAYAAAAYAANAYVASYAAYAAYVASYASSTAAYASSTDAATADAATAYADADAAADAAAYAASYACAATYDTYAAVLTTADRLHVLTTAVDVALDAYRAEGRA